MLSVVSQYVRYTQLIYSNSIIKVINNVECGITIVIYTQLVYNRGIIKAIKNFKCGMTMW